MGKFFF